MHGGGGGGGGGGHLVRITADFLQQILDAVRVSKLSFWAEAH